MHKVLLSGLLSSQFGIIMRLAVGTSCNQRDKSRTRVRNVFGQTLCIRVVK